MVDSVLLVYYASQNNKKNFLLPKMFQLLTSFSRAEPTFALMFIVIKKHSNYVPGSRVTLAQVGLLWLTWGYFDHFFQNHTAHLFEVSFKKIYIVA